MKKILLITILAASALSVLAQNYYAGQEIFIDKTITFKCSILPASGANKLLNINDFTINQRSDKVPAIISIDEYNEIIEANSNFKRGANDAMLNAFHETFTPTELKSMAGEFIVIAPTYNNNGDIVSLPFSFRNTAAMRAISPQKYASLYRKLKTNLKFNIVDKRAYYTSDIVFSISIDKVIAKSMLFKAEMYAK